MVLVFVYISTYHVKQKKKKKKFLKTSQVITTQEISSRKWITPLFTTITNLQLYQNIRPNLQLQQ